MNDALADLGLDLGSSDGVAAAVAAAPAAESTPAVTPAAAPVEPAAAAAKAPREEVEVGEIVIEEDVSLPTLTRTASGSKYPFAKLTAPKGDAATGWKYSSFVVGLLANVDAEKLKRSVQSAATQQNRQSKEAKSEAHYVTRSEVKNGEFVGMRVLRVDGTLDTDETADETAK